MCMDCGCGVAHGTVDPNRSHLVIEDLQRMAHADGTTVEQVLKNIERTADKDRAKHPQEWAGPTQA